MSTISVLFKKHKGQVAHIFGKGPSLTTYIQENYKEGISKTENVIKICINESVLLIPDCNYLFAHDNQTLPRIAKNLLNWPPCCLAIMDSTCYFTGCKHFPAICWYQKRDDKKGVLKYSSQQIAKTNELYGKAGTLHSVIHFCKLIEVDSIMLVGCEGKDGYAKGMEFTPPNNHDGIRHHAIWEMKKLGINYKFYKEGKKMEDNSKNASSEVIKLSEKSPLLTEIITSGIPVTDKEAIHIYCMQQQINSLSLGFDQQQEILHQIYQVLHKTRR